MFENVCPQISHVNEYKWEKIEEEVMKRAKACGDVKVWTGALINTTHSTLIVDTLIPDYYRKVIAYKKDGTKVEEAWLSKNGHTNAHTLAVQAQDTMVHILELVHEYYPDLRVEF